ncbi:MAG: hypothetical protein DYG89_36535 [Caldilinea sp. CFX5]|nr:hypothetical protein [Caldilinea sp. CFX5]
MTPNAIFETGAPMRATQEQLIDQPSYTCSGLSCKGAQWQVQCLSAHDQLWRVSSTTGGSYLVAGATPACPWCGADLLMVAVAPAGQSTNGLHQPSSESFQPERAGRELQWN